MKIFFASSSEVSIPIAEILIKENLLSGFITSPDKPQGRNRQIRENGFAAWSGQSDLPTFKPRNEEEIKQLLIDQKIDLMITCAYGVLIKKSALELPKYGWLNIHFSLLPKYRGAAPVQRAIQNNEKITGISIFKLDSGLDSGPLLWSSEYLIPEKAGAKRVLEELSMKAAEVLPSLIKSVESWGFKDQLGEPTIAPKISKDENRINFNSSAEYIFSNFKALEINGGIHCIFRNEKLALIDIEIVDKKLPPGSLEIENEGIFVGTSTNALLVKSLKPAGKNSMKVRDWLNGARIKSGEIFE